MGTQAIAKRAAARSVEVRAQRASQVAQGLVVKHAERIEGAFVDALKNGTRSQRIRAAEGMLKLALASERLDVAESKTGLEHLDRQQLLDQLAAGLTEARIGPLLRRRLEVIDGEAEVVRIVVELQRRSSGLMVRR